MQLQAGEQSQRFSVVLGTVFSVSVCFKALLIPAYKSTDFDVHRNWLAITHSLPLSQWYYDATSQWTLDYPPFFAWFEWLLSQPAALIDPSIVNIFLMDYASPSCVLYQRFTVILSDLTLLYALYQYYEYQTSRPHTQDHFLATRRSLVVSVFLLLNYGLIIVDHIHFQYNGFLFGFLLLSVVRIMQGRHLEGGFWFAVLLNLKHIFLYLSPAYFVYLLKHYCFSASSAQFLPRRFLQLGTVVVCVFLVSFGPFIYLGQLIQVLFRLFPFKRGLCHAYWAPNLWALYSFGDIIAAFFGQRLNILSGSCDSEVCGHGSMTSGLVGEMEFRVFPNIAPWVTLVVTALSILPGLVRAWLREEAGPLGFVKLLVLCAYSSFLCGWHVHEKAVLLITIPMSLLAVEEKRFGKVFTSLSLSAHISLLPLLYQPAETVVKWSLLVLCTCLTAYSFGEFLCLPPVLSPRSSSGLAVNTPAPTETDSQLHLKEKPHPSFSITFLGVLSHLQTCSLALVLAAQGYCVLVHWWGPLQRLEFLPLLLTSTSCAASILLSWGQFLILFFKN